MCWCLGLFLLVLRVVPLQAQDSVHFLVKLHEILVSPPHPGTTGWLHSLLVNQSLPQFCVICEFTEGVHSNPSSRLSTKTLNRTGLKFGIRTEGRRDALRLSTIQYKICFLLTAPYQVFKYHSSILYTAFIPTTHYKM